MKYIQHRPGEDKEPDGRKFFDETEENLDGRDLRKAIRELEDSKVVLHKLTLAPEIDPQDKKAYTREIMQQLAEEKGQDLRWVAVEHNNTAHHHVHVVILGKDNNGKDVRIGKDDYSKMREWSDRYLERVHPFELEKYRDDRTRKEKERIESRKKEREAQRQERIREGLELPWMHKKIIREQIEPYKRWKKEQEEKQHEQKLEKSRDGKSNQPLNEKIQAAGKEWSKQNSESELRELNAHLWDNPDERIPLPEYKKLVAWIKEKERSNKPERNLEKTAPDAERQTKKKEAIEYQGQKYNKDSSYDKLTELANKLREKGTDRLPIDQYQKLRGWIENADRARWAGVTDRQLKLSKTQFGKEGAAKTSPQANRYVNPLQQQMMSNPVVGLFMQGASIANELVRWIDLRDNRDRLKEAKDNLEDAKRNKHQDYVKPERTHEEKARDQETIEDIDKAIDENKDERKRRRKEKEKEREKRDRGLDFTR
ncbi:MAG: hypothetical protein SFY67_05790 [Candidatus Melainabacteria bacterium]|nr:hypothetical protein [Candidatus Melainabacteria bacterium]